MHFSVKANYPENNEFNWNDLIQQYADIGRAEVSFYSTELFLKNVRAEDVIEPLQKNSFEISSVHMAHVGIDDFPLFELILDKTIDIAKKLGCQYIVVHPSKCELNQVKDFVKNTVDRILHKEKIYLCWETFTSKKRFLSGIEGISEFCRGTHWHKACYDFSHIHDPQEEVIKQIAKYIDLIRVFHISNRIAEQKIQHLPIFHKGEGQLDLDFVQILKFLKEKDYLGGIVLEYLPEFHAQLIEDTKFLINKFD